MPIDYSTYPSNWKSEIRPAILKRSNGCCERCRIRNYSVGYRSKDGFFIGTCGNILHDLAGEGLSYPSLLPLSYKEAKQIADVCNELEYDEHYFVVVLTVAHLDHDITNNDHENLAALCQRCHLVHDITHHKESRKQSSNKRKGIQTLF